MINSLTNNKELVLHYLKGNPGIYQFLIDLKNDREIIIKTIEQSPYFLSIIPNHFNPYTTLHSIEFHDVPRFQASTSRKDLLLGVVGGTRASEARTGKQASNDVAT